MRLNQESHSSRFHRSRRSHGDSRRTLVACSLSALLAAGGTALAGSQGAFAAGGQRTIVINPGTTTIVAGYGYSCQDTTRTPNWGCQYGAPSGPAGTPITTVFKGSRTMTIQSLLRPTVRFTSGEYWTTVKR